MLSPVRDTYDNQERQQIPYSAGTQQENVHQSQNEVTPPSQFCEKMCWKYSCGCISLVIVGLLISFGLLLLFSPLGLLVAALVPGAIILYCTWLFYQDQVTKGQMIVSFFECILWMIPLLIWDLIFLLAIQPHLKDTGLSGTAILAYFINFYFFAGFCEELVKYFVIRRILNSLLTPDWRSMLVYGICAGAGFACTENILYVFSGGYATAVVRAALSVPLHCTTGAIIGMTSAKERALQTHYPFYKVIFVPWLVHGSYDFLLTIGYNAKHLGVLSIISAILFYVFGLVYARYLANEMHNMYPQKINIHSTIMHNHPPIIGVVGISQYGHSTDFVCQCCSMLLCCCPSQANHVIDNRMITPMIVSNQPDMYNNSPMGHQYPSPIPMQQGVGGAPTSVPVYIYNSNDNV